MSEIAANPLLALTQYYDRLQASGHAVAEFGFSRQKVTFVVVIEKDGSLHGIQDARVETDGRTVPRQLIVPGQSKPSGQGINPCFLWDTARYMLGLKPDDKDPQRTAGCFKAFRDRHLSLEDAVADPGFSAVCRFLEAWTPATADLSSLPDMSVGFGVFRIRGENEYLHERPRVKQFWTAATDELSGDQQEPAVSLMTGQSESIARIHKPKIKGVCDAQPSGAVLVGFNESAYESYGKRQSYNAPVGLRDAFRYATALNRLLDDRSRRVQIGDATVVFWTGQAQANEAEEVFAAFFAEGVGRDKAGESGRMVDRLHAFLIAARQGRLGDEIGAPDAPFYILGLSPNAGRINVRFWLAGTVAQFAGRLAEHTEHLTMAGSGTDRRLLSIAALLDETVPPKKGGQGKGWPDRARVSPLLGGALTRSILLGLPYPSSLFSSVLARIRAEGFATRDRTSNNYRRDHDWKAIVHRRAAIIKAYLIRNRKREVPVSLNKDHPEQAYHLGRLFAALEKTQEDSSERELNSTIKDRYFGAASATPGAVFPLLLRLHQHHLNKVENVGRRVNREKLVGEICGHLKRFPRHLALDDQGLFYVGYYHQRQGFFTKKTQDEKEAAHA